MAVDTTEPKPVRSLKRKLASSQAIHVKAAEYWLALGNVEEAVREVDQIDLQEHPDVKQIREKIATETRYIGTMLRDDSILEPYWDFEQQ